MSGTKAERMKAEEEANALILQQSEKNSTLDNKNTEQTEETPLNADNENRTPDTAVEKPQSDSEQTWQAKYKVLQGKYNAEVPQLRDEIRALKSELSNVQAQSDNSELINQIKQLEGKLEAKDSQPISNNDELDDYIATEYGPDLSRAIKNMIGQHIKPEANVATTEVNELKNQVSDIQRQSNESRQAMLIQTLESMLKSDGIDFKQVDSDPLFHEWLANEEGATGQPKQSFLTQHFNAGDLQRTAAFYRDFKAQERSTYDKNPLSNHVDASSNSAPPLEDASASVWTQDDIARLYEDKRRNRISQEDFDRYEQDLNRAMQEGRVSP